MADIFLSYSRKDKDRIQRFIDVFEKQGWSVWSDHKIRIGKSFDQVIEQELNRSKCLVVLWSENSILSDWVKSEASEGKARKILAPILIDKVKIPFGFRRTETADLSDWDGLDETHTELDILLSSMHHLIDTDPPDWGKDEPQHDQQHSIKARLIKPLPNVGGVKDRYSTNQILFGIAGLLMGLLLASIVLFLVLYFYIPKRTATRTTRPVATNGETFRVRGIDSNDVLNIRLQPGSENPIVGTIPPYGRGIKVTGKGKSVKNRIWYPIEYEGKKGWVSSRYLARE